MLRDINGNKLRTRWISEFCGFMWGEGYIGITKYFKHKGENNEFVGNKNNVFVGYRGQVSIQLREDDLDILKDIQSKLGGHIWKAKPRKIFFKDTEKEYQQNPTYGWISVNKEELKRIVKILEKGMFPSKKKKNVKLLKRYLKISENIYKNDDVKKEIASLRVQIQKANHFNE